MAAIVLKDGNGNPVTYEGVTELALPTADGGIHTFGSTGWTAETIKTNGGGLDVTSSQMTIPHGLGAVPDLIFIGRLDVDDNVDRNSGTIAWAIGWSRRMMDIDNFSGYGALNEICIDYPDGDGNVRYGRFSYTEAIDETHTVYKGMIREANATSFVVGCDGTESVVKGLHTQAKYFWFAISGLGVRMNPTSEV